MKEIQEKSTRLKAAKYIINQTLECKICTTQQDTTPHFCCCEYARLLIIDTPLEMASDLGADNQKRPQLRKLFSLNDSSRVSLTSEGEQPSHFRLFGPSPKKTSSTPLGDETLNGPQITTVPDPCGEGAVSQVHLDFTLFHERFQFFLDYQRKSKANNCLRYAQVRNEVYRNWMTKTLNGMDESLREYTRKAAHNLNLNRDSKASDHHSMPEGNESSSKERRNIHQINEEANRAVYKALDALQKRQSGLHSSLTSFVPAASAKASLENQKQLMLVELWAADIIREFSGSQSLLTSAARRHIYKALNSAPIDPNEIVSKPEICFLFTQLPFGLTKKPTADDLNVCWSWQLAYDEPLFHINAINLCDSVGVVIDANHRQAFGGNPDFKREMNNVYLENFSLFTTLSYSLLPLPDNSQTAIVIYDSYVHVKRADLRKTLKEFHRALQADGLVQFSLMDLNSMIPEGQTAYDKERRSIYDGMYDNSKDEGNDIDCLDSLARLLPQIGFKEVKYSVVAFPGINSLPLYENPFKAKSSSLSRNVEYAGTFSGMGSEKLRTAHGQGKANNASESTGYKDDDMNALSESLHNYCEFMLMFKTLNLDGSNLEEKLDKDEISLPEYVKLIDQARRYIAYKCKERRPEEFEKNLQEAKSVPMNDDRDSINAVIDSILSGKPSARRRRDRLHQRCITDDGMQCGVIVTAKK